MKSGYHLLTLDQRAGTVEVKSDPIYVKAVSSAFIIENLSGRYLGVEYDDFDTFWKYASKLKRNSVAAAFPEKRT